MINCEEVLSWGKLDIEKLDEWLKTARVWDIDEGDVEQFINNVGGDVRDINSWFYAVISLLHEEILNYVEDRLDENDEDYDDLVNQIRQLRENFNPFINYLDSWFNDVIDEINYDDPDKATEQLIKKLKED